MKTFITKIAAPIFLAFFVFGLVSTANAAFPGKKQQSKEITDSRSDNGSSLAVTPTPPALPASSDDLVLLVVLCFLLPPVAVYLKFNEIGTPFWINVVLTLLFWIPGVIHALIVVLR